MIDLVIWVCMYGAKECDPVIRRSYPTVQECGVASRDLAAELEERPLAGVVWYYCEDTTIDASSAA